jgi:DNA-directed RNA polymerase specialized sigma24 family protein
LYYALCALRDADPRFAKELGWAWRIVSAWLDEHVRSGPDPDDLRQTVILRLYRSAGTMKATTAREAKAWLGRIARNLLHDQRGHRKRRRDWGGMRVIDGAEGEPAVHLVDLLPAAEVERTPQDVEHLAQFRDRLFDRVDRWLSGNVRRPAKRSGDRLRAETAWLANVEGFDAGEISARLGEAAPAKGTLYKWVERGREEVLLPTLEAWLDELAPDASRSNAEEEVGDARVSVAQARELLVSCRRADAGRPRTHDRKDGAGLSDQHGPLAQGGGHG